MFKKYIKNIFYISSLSHPPNLLVSSEVSQSGEADTAQVGRLNVHHLGPRVQQQFFEKKLFNLRGINQKSPILLVCRGPSRGVPYFHFGFFLSPIF